jgi:[ribosomal protein S18]-alanine N-acetyltransferase
MQLEDVAQVHLIDQLSFSMPWPENAFRYELIQNSYSLCRVAEAAQPDGKHLVVAESVVWLILDEAHIATIAVHPDFRGQGISRLLLVTILCECIRKGARISTLEVRANNQVAQALYQRFRFEVAGRRPHYYRDNNEDALIMTADLCQYVDADQETIYLDWLESGQWANQDRAARSMH